MAAKSGVPRDRIAQIETRSGLENVERIIAGTGCSHRVAVVSNPEFLREGAAIGDFKRPDRIVIGSEDEFGREVTREDQLRQVFNSPFWPFVLASTSVGQEGLDFHTYSHAIVHWNLPGNPVDLEQREGRVHRYKGHAVRKNVATDFGEPAAVALTYGRNFARAFSAGLHVVHVGALQRIDAGALMRVDEDDLVGVLAGLALLGQRGGRGHLVSRLERAP